MTPRRALRPAAAAAPVAAALTLALAACEPSREDVAAVHEATLDSYCAECHDEAQREGDLVLAAAPLADAPARALVW
jgi:hypothetical protein